MAKVFISYSHKDKQWVKDWFLPRLEDVGLEVCIDFRDFKIGRVSVLNMEDAVKTCDRTILVLSPQWLESHWGILEAFMLQTKDPINLNERILPLMLEKCELPDRLSIFTYADFTDEGTWESELCRLLEQIGITVPIVSHKPSNDTEPIARRAIKSFSGGPGAPRGAY
jgi:hypothetical protein